MCFFSIIPKEKCGFNLYIPQEKCNFALEINAK